MSGKALEPLSSSKIRHSCALRSAPWTETRRRWSILLLQRRERPGPKMARRENYKTSRTEWWAKMFIFLAEVTWCAPIASSKYARMIPRRNSFFLSHHGRRRIQPICTAYCVFPTRIHQRIITPLKCLWNERVSNSPGCLHFFESFDAKKGKSGFQSIKRLRAQLQT